jgi:hypothetical protein
MVMQQVADLNSEYLQGIISYENYVVQLKQVADAAAATIIKN